MRKFNAKFDLRNHAIEQYLSRKRSSCGAADTYHFLKRQINKHVYKLPNKTRSGEDKWHVPTANCILICKYENGINVVVTIINDDRLVHEINVAEDDFMDKLSKLDTTSYMSEQLAEMVRNNKTEVVEKISSRTKVHKAIVDGKVIKFNYNTNSKIVEVVSQEYV